MLLGLVFENLLEPRIVPFLYSIYLRKLYIFVYVYIKLQHEIKRIHQGYYQNHCAETTQ